MKKLLLITLFFIATLVASFAQTVRMQIGGKVAYSGDDVIFHQIDKHTWVGTGKLMANESLYLVEGKNKAVLIDAGTKIPNLEKIVASITSKPVTMIATHVHPDHVGAIDCFPEIYINLADTVNISQFMSNYKGEIKFLKDEEIINLGCRKLQVVFTPGHTPGSTTFIDKKNHYGFSGDSFGSGNLLLTTDFSTLLSTCKKMKMIMTKYKITKLYPGHYFGLNEETKQRVDDLITISNDVLSGKIKGEKNLESLFDLNLLINKYGVRVNYSESNIK